MQIAIKIKQRCLLCKHKIKKDDVILIRKNGTVVHDSCAKEVKKRLPSNA